MNFEDDITEYFCDQEEIRLYTLPLSEEEQQQFDADCAVLFPDLPTAMTVELPLTQVMQELSDRQLTFSEVNKVLNYIKQTTDWEEIVRHALLYTITL